MLEDYIETLCSEYDSKFTYNKITFHCKCIVNYYSKTTDFCIFSSSGIEKIGCILPYICTDIKARQDVIIKSLESHFKLKVTSSKSPIDNHPLLPF